LTTFTNTFEQTWQRIMADKLGLITFNPATDESLLADLNVLLNVAETDMTLFYRDLASITQDDTSEAFYKHLETSSYQPLSAENQALAGAWFTSYQARLKIDNRPTDERQQRMNAVNPRYVLRNYLAQQAIDRAEQNDFAEVWELLDVLRNPCTEQPGKQRFAEKRPDWAKQRAGCSMLSCSS
jgi:uncharacterized protein YdiU (UPF0061 family)